MPNVVRDSLTCELGRQLMSYLLLSRASLQLIGYTCRIVGTSFNVIVENEDQVEVSFTRMWDPSMEGKLSPLNIDKRFYCVVCLVRLKLIHTTQSLITLKNKK